MGKGNEKPKRPVPASTVILVRDECDAFQVYLVRRSVRSSFMPGNYVFPGGKVDPGDRNTEYWIERVDLGCQEILKRFGGSMNLDAIIVHCVSAIRETFEEVGLLLTRSPEGDFNIPNDLAAARIGGALKKGWLRDVVQDKDWNLALSRLFPWSHWITPEAMPLRYDTRFFLALAPAGQTCVPDRNETTRGIWVSPEKALGENLTGNIPLSPPTLATLQGLLEYSTVEGMVQEWRRRSWGAVNMPRLVPFSKGPLIVLPWDPFYENIGEGEKGEGEVEWLKLGETFSRLLYHEGLWKPVRIV